MALHRGVRHGGVRLRRANRADAGLRPRREHRAPRRRVRERKPAAHGPPRAAGDERPGARGRAYAGPHAPQGGAGVPPPQERLARAGGARVREPGVRPAQAHVPQRRHQRHAHQQGGPRDEPPRLGGSSRGARHDAPRLALPDRPRFEPEAVQHGRRVRQPVRARGQSDCPRIVGARNARDRRSGRELVRVRRAFPRALQPGFSASAARGADAERDVRAHRARSASTRDMRRVSLDRGWGSMASPGATGGGRWNAAGRRWRWRWRSRAKTPSSLRFCAGA